MTTDTLLPGIDLECVLLEIRHTPFVIVAMVLRYDAERHRVEDILPGMHGDMPARCRQRQDSDAIGTAVPYADMTRLARFAIGGIVHRAVHDVAPGCGPLHPVWQLDAVRH